MVRKHGGRDVTLDKSHRLWLQVVFGAKDGGDFKIKFTFQLAPLKTELLDFHVISGVRS